MSHRGVDKPNILLITTDQQHAGLMSCAGDAHVKTPSLDRLASQGVRFERAYSSNPLCVPCRYSFLTGRMPHVFDGLEHNHKNDEDNTPPIPENILKQSMGWLFRNAGYNTVLGGKLHVEGSYLYLKDLEDRFGFTCLRNHTREELAHDCADFLRSQPKEPFLLWASFDNPHDICGFMGQEQHDDSLPHVPLPANAPPTENEAEWMTGFRTGTLGTEEEFELGLNRDYALAAREWDENEWRLYRAEYRKHMEAVDSQIGLALDALENSGCAENAVIIFTCDHGDHDGAHGLAMKRSFYDESARVPFIISDPGSLRGKADTTHLINNGLALLPTLCDYAGIDILGELGGTSLRGLAEGVPSPTHRDFTVSESVGGRMVRTARYKYCLYCFNKAEEMLFDMEREPGEMLNIAGEPQMQSVLAEHRAILSEWAHTENDTKGQGYLAALRFR